MQTEKTIYPAISQGTLTPAYGRDYKNKREVLKAFQDGKDFQIHWPGSSTHCSIRDGIIGETVKIRYDNQTKVVFYVITDTDFFNS